MNAPEGAHRLAQDRDCRSNFPVLERNLQTGGRNYDDTSAQSGTIKVYHDREHASYVEVAVVAK